MIRLFLYRFFKTYQKSIKSLDKFQLSKFTSHQNLIDKIMLEKNFLYLWREKISSIILNEKYKIKNIKISKSNNYYRSIIKILHSFDIMDHKTKTFSKELRGKFFSKNFSKTKGGTKHYFSWRPSRAPNWTIIAPGRELEVIRYHQSDAETAWDARTLCLRTFVHACRSELYMHQFRVQVFVAIH